MKIMNIFHGIYWIKRLKPMVNREWKSLVLTMFYLYSKNKDCVSQMYTVTSANRVILMWKWKRFLWAYSSWIFIVGAHRFSPCYATFIECIPLLQMCCRFPATVCHRAYILVRECNREKKPLWVLIMLNTLNFLDSHMLS